MGKVQDKLEKIYSEDDKRVFLLEVEEQVAGGPAIPLSTSPPPKSKPRGLSVSEIEDRPDVSPAGEKAAEEKYGNVSFADEENKKYPIDKEHIHAAISYFGMPKNYDKYSVDDRKKIASRIAAAAKKFGVDLSDDWKSKHGI
jgi:hypothetical protein